MSVRAAVVGDAEAIAQVHTTTWQVAYRGVIPDEFLDGISWEQRAVGWRRNIVSGSVFVATVEESVVGFIAVGPARDAPGPFELYAIYLLPPHWGSGLASSLVDAALPDQPTILWVVEDNPRARRFYERHGFVLDGVTRVDTIGGREVAEVRYTRTGLSPR